ncbi:hypothetical protein BGZ76_010807 [Entomortierella beljakovae]|nr:hypothetical protein BGZ76_010807 [Entomortierella beljakovae]
MLFSEKPNWSEFEWIQDPNGKTGMMIPIAPQLKMNMANNGIQPIHPSGGGMQQQRNVQNNPQSAINPPFRNDQRQGSNPNVGPTLVGFNTNKGNFGPGGVPPQQQQQQQQQPQPPPQQQPQPQPLPPPPQQQPQPQPQSQQHSINGPTNSTPSLGQGSGSFGNRSHHGQYQGHGVHPNNSQPIQQSQNPSQNPNNSPASSNARHSKPNKHSKIHRDLDAPDSYPSPRSGLTTSADDFAREMKLASSQGSLVLNGGPAGPGHMRKKPKVEIE